MVSLAGEKDTVQLKLSRVSSSYNVGKQNEEKNLIFTFFKDNPHIHINSMYVRGAWLKFYVLRTYILRWTTPKATIEFLTPSIIEKNPLHNEALWSEMYQRSLDFGRRGIFLAGLSAIDIALWDIKGKHFGWIFLDFSVANSLFLISKM